MPEIKTALREGRGYLQFKRYHIFGGFGEKKARPVKKTGFPL
jgi:hypothetical protein